MAVRPAEIAVVALARARPGVWPVTARFLRKKPLGAAGGVLMLLMALTAVFADDLQTHDPIATNAAYTLGAPNAEHWLGTDHLGRDIYSRIVHGARVSLIVGLASTLLGSVLGGLVGLLSGYIGGKTELVAARFLPIPQGPAPPLPALVLFAPPRPALPNLAIPVPIPSIPRAAPRNPSDVLAHPW